MSKAANDARTAWSSSENGVPKTAMIPSPVNWFTVPSYRCTTRAERSNKSAMSSRQRSGPTVAAMSIECTTSAKSTVTCLYSAVRALGVTAAPHSWQNFASSRFYKPGRLPPSPSAKRRPFGLGRRQVDE
jgi:hypothetical protein